MKAPTVKQLKIAGAVILIVAAIIVIVQNTEAVETKLLFVSVSMPRAVLLLVALLVGFALGLISASKVRFFRSRKREESVRAGRKDS